MDASSKISRKLNPVEKANFISRLTFFYVFPIFKRAYKNGLTQDDLFNVLDEHKSSVLGEKLENIFREDHRKRKKFALHVALCKLFGLSFLLYGVVRFLDGILLLAVIPLAMGKLINYFETGQNQISNLEAYIYASLIVLCRLADAFMVHGTMMGSIHLSMKMRVACSSLIYRKILRLKKTALADTTVGHLVNLLSNDVGKFDQGICFANFAWIAPLQVIVSTYLLYEEIGVSSIYGMVLLLSMILLQASFSKICSSLRLKIAFKTDIRVRLINEVVSGIHVIKMYCWEKPFGQLISLVRRQEVKAIRSRGYLLGLTYSFEMFIIRVTIFVSILAYVLLGNYVTAKRMFAVTTIYTLLRTTVTSFFSIGVNSLAEVYISVKRIQNFLSLGEQEIGDFTKSHLRESFCQEPLGKPRISLKNVYARWSTTSSDNIVKDINLEITSNQLVAVIGEVGSGKSSLFNVILKELPIENGTLSISGEISYSSQEPWLFSASVRQNILFGNEYDKERYEEVVRICALDSDFNLLPYGDKTLVGEHGKSLSGGQKARINLARCIYKSADIYLLDDPLSAVDANVGRHLYENCIKKFLHDKICLVITHQLQYLNNADKIIILNDGTIEMEGNYSELQQSGLDFTKLMVRLHDEEMKKEETKEKKTQSMKKMNSAEDERFQDGPSLEKESMETGNVKFSHYLSYFKAGGGLCNAGFMLLIFIAAQAITNCSDYFVTYWVNIEDDFRRKNLSSESGTREMLSRETLLYTYSGFTFAVIVFGIVHGIYYMSFFSLASSTLHNISFSNIIKATMRFFNNNPSGRILNRFARDLGYIDEYIPLIYYDVIRAALELLGAIILAVIVNYWLCLPSLVLLLLLYGLRNIYIETSRSVKRIEGIARSLIYGHMTASICGLSTIRTFSAQPVLIKEFDEYQDKHSSAYYIFIASNRCFGFWIDAITVIFLGFVISFLLYFKQNMHGGDVGLVITQFIGLADGLQWGIRQWSELENQMVSVERLLEYSKVETDPDRPKPGYIRKDWPAYGQIEFHDVSLKYNPGDSPVLRSLNFTIKPKEKVGIVGRTGAGKSSTITALFQLYPVEGKIIIDGVDTTQLPLEYVRFKISIIPQDPVLFSGTLRKNLDPFAEYDDKTLWNALEQAKMKDVIAELSEGLESYVSEGGTNFSVGQRQLICLARALIRNNKILVMDEATANVDPYTDAIIQNTIREKFADCTVLTIAHRLHTVMDSDRILVMNAGAVEEFDRPYCLLSNKEGLLYKLVQTTGKTNATNLENVAKESYHRKLKAEDGLGDKCVSSVLHIL